MSKSKENSSILLELNHVLESLVFQLMPIRIVLVFISSALTVILSLLVAFAFRFELDFKVEDALGLPKIIILAMVVKLVIFLLFKLYSCMWRYVSIVDIIKIFSANFVASAVLVIIVYYFRQKYFHGFSLAVLGIDFFTCFFIMSGKRVLTRIIRESAAKSNEDKFLRTILVGGAEGINGLLQTFAAGSSQRKIIGVISDEMKIGQTLRGVPVLGKVDSTAKCAKKHRASEILLLPPNSTPHMIRQILEDLENREAKCELRMIPAYMDIAEGNVNVSHIREVEIEDLLGRKPVKLDRGEVASFVDGKNILVTGAGGSIGSELCHQIASYNPAKVVLFELSEFNLYEINRKLKTAFPELALVNIIGNVGSEENVTRALCENDIEVVYHAAAYKHVPLMEENMNMAFSTNVLGTANLAACCEQSGVKRMVFISTDKAVFPTSVMGASKRIAERVVLERKTSKTEFVVVRFGNVLGSSGSVIPLFKQQIKDGGPVTVTSDKVVRYFMSIPEAVDLVLQAGTIGHDRDIMVLEMGEQIRIYDMAKKLIELSGLTPGEDIDIEVTGLRPGEKEYEELMTDEEKVDRTPFEKIFVARKMQNDLAKVDLEKIRIIAAENRRDELTKLVHEYVPENKFHEAS